MGIPAFLSFWAISLEKEHPRRKWNTVQTLQGHHLQVLTLVVFQVIYPLHMEKAMAPHSSTLSWKIPWMEEPGRLQSMGSLTVGHD